MNRKKCEWRIVKTTRNHHTSGIEPRIKYDAEEKNSDSRNLEA
jgi:hypothetical protein